jgi:Domain of unknown function (DUF4406)
MRNHIYIAGPMQGHENFNFRSFEYAAVHWRELGWTVFNPAEKDEEEYGPDIGHSKTGDIKDAEAKGFSLRRALAIDLSWICENADAIYMLEGWENSKGAQAEWTLARALGLSIFYE